MVSNKSYRWNIEFSSVLYGQRKTIKIDTSIQHTGQIFNKAKVTTENKSFSLYQWETKKKKEMEGAPSGVNQS